MIPVRSPILLLLLFVSSLAGQPATAQAPFEWAKQAVGYDCGGRAITSDAAGNTYTVGNYSDSIRFGESVLQTKFSYTGFIAKHDAGGKFLWAKNLSDYNDVQARGITADRQGNIYVCGRFEGSSVIIGKDTLVDTSHWTLDNGFVAKYDLEGNPLWATAISSKRFYKGMTIDDAGNVYAAGIDVVKFDPSGKVIWSRQFNPWGYPFTESGVAVDEHGKTYISGSGYIIGKRDKNGDSLWLKTGPKGKVAGFAVTYRKPGYVYVAGDFTGHVDFGDVKLTSLVNAAGDSLGNRFLARYDTTGKVVWVTRIGLGLGSYSENVFDITTDSDANVFVCGKITDSAYFADITAYGTGAFAAKYNLDGELIWVSVTTVDTIGRFKSGNASADGMAIDATGNVYLTGFFNGKVNFDTTKLTNLTPGFTSPGSMFIAKLGAYPPVVENIDSLSGAVVRIWPNPTKDELSINIGRDKKYQELRLLDQAGRTVLKEYIPSGGNTIGLNTRNLSTGVYYVQLVGNSGSETAKIVVQH